MRGSEKRTREGSSSPLKENNAPCKVNRTTYKSSEEALESLKAVKNSAGSKSWRSCFDPVINAIPQPGKGSMSATVNAHNILCS